MAGFLQKLLTAGEGKQLKVYNRRLEQISALEAEMKALSDDEFPALTARFRERLAAGETLDDLQVEAFAATREAAWRALGMRHFDVQLIGAMILHDGMIAEMKTGEGKTLAATAAVYLNALAGNGVHVVTVNDYLASRDAEWMGRVYKFLGLKVGLIQSMMDVSLRRLAYEADVTYGTNSEFGFDYLRDNMVTRPEDRVQRGHSMAVVDEVDSILIDEARTPLIISGAASKSADTYKDFAKVIPRLTPEVDFDLDEAKRTIAPTEVGVSKVERMLGIEDLYADPTGQMVNHLQQALKAEYLFKLDVDYMIADGEVLIVDEYTGRPMVGRRYSEGLHQAIEAKERVHIREENQTLATITLQNYFRMYEKLAGMTGTALTEDQEFREIYNLPVMVVPTHRDMVRDDRNDLVYRSVEAKYKAVADFVAERHAAGQPCLLGTISIENSERLSRLLMKRGVPHSVLNAKHHAQEARIIAQAGRLGAVTIATNMAGRGTDIILGGNPDQLSEELLRSRGIDPAEATDEQRAEALTEAKVTCAAEHEQVVAAGGLAVIGTERHESRRIDNQLRGRAGRQGDPGLSQFYLSLEDDLMRLFGGDRMLRVADMMARADVPDDMPIQAGLVSKAVESAQKQVETMHFASRKYVLEYDDVMNLQRQAIYGERNRILDGKDIHGRTEELIEETVRDGVQQYVPEQSYTDDWDISGLAAWHWSLTGIEHAAERISADADSPREVADGLLDVTLEYYRKREEEIGAPNLREIERQVMLRVLDTRWMSHLQEMDYLKEGIGLRAMGQRDPIVEYKNEAYDMFGALVAGINEDFVITVLHMQVRMPEEASFSTAPMAPRNVTYSAPSEDAAFRGVAEAATKGMGPSSAQMQAAAATAGSETRGPAQVIKDTSDPFATAGRNDPCPCGSGKKFKKCHGAGN